MFDNGSTVARFVYHLDAERTIPPVAIGSAAVFTVGELLLAWLFAFD